MKKTIIALFALAGIASADAILSTDFTTESTDWTVGQWNGWDTPQFVYGENGAVVNKPWKQNTLTTTVGMPSGIGYTITFTTFGDGNEQAAMFFLTSSTDNYSIVMGNSYNSNNFISVGTLDSAIVDRTQQSGQTTQGLVSFQTGHVNPTVLATSGDAFATTFAPLTTRLR